MNDHRYKMMEDVIGYRNRLREKSRTRIYGRSQHPTKTRESSISTTLKMQRRVRRTRLHFVIPTTIGAAKLLINCSPGLLFRNKWAAELIATTGVEFKLTGVAWRRGRTSFFLFFFPLLFLSFFPVHRKYTFSRC